MTSRATAGTQRQPQRSLSGTSMIQRSKSNRTLSQYASSTAIRKSDNFVDLTQDGSETGRCGSSRIGGSRLKLELTKDAKEPTALCESPKAANPPLNPHPVRGRPRLRFDNYRPRLQDGTEPSLLSSIEGVENITGRSSMPMPRRPGQTARLFARSKRSPAANTMKKDLRPKPYVLEVPAGAPHYPPHGNADFFPWTGNHPEDQFTDNVIRQGFFDKSQTTQNETGSAKVSIFPALKNKSGLQSLSSLFTSVLSQRRTHGQITSAPTFKPPPRVTLTDTKRETWLRDLASPNISLRRLSRTIPHGIRGKVLLEQCLSKRIPTERAVWLAKCVGANEIRAFKRKGVTGTFALGGEAKWIRDWTTFVEQFVESIVASCGEPNWKGKMLYAIRLATHLYSEHLLDREHYMDWLSTSLETCALTRAPIWLLVTQIYWADLQKHRKYGRRLVGAMCAHLQMAHDSPDKDLLTPLIERIAFLIKGLLETNSENFISPKFWAKYKTTLASSLSPDQQSQLPTYISVEERNERLAPSIFGKDLTPRQLIISLLDKTLCHPFTIELPQKCREIMTDSLALAESVISWATSSHRPGVAKVYVGARLLRTWSTSGIDVNEVMLAFIGSEKNGAGLDKASLYHLASELMRSGHFCISKYLQWLIARGGVRSPRDLARDGPCATRLLAELPTHDIPDSIERLRRTMLSRASYSLDQELAEVQRQTDMVKSCIPEQNHHSTGNADSERLTSNSLISQRSDLSRTIKSAIGVSIRKHFRLYAAHSMIPPTNSWKDEKMNHTSVTITSHDFNLVRQVLEEVEDFSMLADVLQIVTLSDDVQILAALADTLNLHIEAFAAIGAVNELFNKLLGRLRSLTDSSYPRALLASLSDLASKLPGAESASSELSRDLALRYQKTVADACSPVSDHMAEVLQNSQSDFCDEIERVLSSGTTMEQSTLQRLFEMMISRIEASWTGAIPQPRDCALLLARLKHFDIKYFSSLMTDWLQRLLQTTKRPSLSQVLGPLVSVDCVDLKDVITSSAAMLESKAATNNAAAALKAAVETLALLLGIPNESDIVTASDAYMLDVKRIHLRNYNHREALAVARRAIEFCAPSRGFEHEYLVSLCHGQQMRSFLRYVVLNDIDAAMQVLVIPLAKKSHPDCLKQINNLICGLLDSDAGNSTDSQTIEHRIEHALHLADDLTIPFSQLEIQLILATEVPAWGNEDNETAGWLEAFERAIDLAITSTNRSWASIVRTLDIQIARHLCQRAERLFLQLIPSIKADEPDNLTPEDNIDLANRLLFVVDATIYSLELSRTSQLASQIVDKLNDLWQVTSQADVQSRNHTVSTWLPLILDFITLHPNMFDSSKSSTELRSRMLLSLLAILLELQIHSNINSALVQRLFDVALLLIDELPEEARLNCARALKDKTSDSRIGYLFGYPSLATDWLQLNQKGKLVMFPLRRWETLSDPTPNVGENDTSLSLTLFGARRV